MAIAASTPVARASRIAATSSSVSRLSITSAASGPLDHHQHLAPQETGRLWGKWTTKCTCQRKLHAGAILRPDPICGVPDARTNSHRARSARYCARAVATAGVGLVLSIGFGQTQMREKLGDAAARDRQHVVVASKLEAEVAIVAENLLREREVGDVAAMNAQEGLVV